MWDWCQSSISGIWVASVILIYEANIGGGTIYMFSDKKYIK